ncbi:hypothetical protein [Streptomyces tauricus]|uniref:hypothetical protein n=1 Tax=Streptomyces tauricus TaxID=68274 RepID=UPI003824D2AD
MTQQMNGAQRKTVWIKVLGMITAVALAGIGAYVAVNQDGPGTQKTCESGTVCGDDNDSNHLGDTTKHGDDGK